jgi:hypothetical protein
VTLADGGSSRAEPKDGARDAVPDSPDRGHIYATAAYVADQAVCSAGNFFTSFLAAKNLPADQFGVFALLNVITMFSLTVNNWLIRSSLSETSQLASQSEVRSFTGTLVGLAAIFGFIPAAVLICASYWLHHIDLCLPLALMAFAGQIQETLRRSAMAQSLYKAGLLGDVVSYIGQSSIIFGLVLGHLETLQSIFWTLGATSVLSVVLQAILIQLRRPTRLLAAARKCWDQGRWITLSGIVLSPLVYGTPWILDLTRGQTSAAMLSALILVLGLSNPLMFSTTWLILVRGQAAKRSSVSVLLRRVVRPALLTSIPLFCYWVIVLFFPHRVLALFFGRREPYSHLEGSLQLVVVYYVIAYLAVCLEVLMDTRDKSRQRLSVDIWASLLMLSCGFFAAWAFGLPGVLIVGLIAQLIRATGYSILLAKPSKKLEDGCPIQIVAQQGASI